jgi:hypothetical protein
MDMATNIIDTRKGAHIIAGDFNDIQDSSHDCQPPFGQRSPQPGGLLEELINRGLTDTLREICPTPIALSTSTPRETEADHRAYYIDRILCAHTPTLRAGTIGTDKLLQHYNIRTDHKLVFSDLQVHNTTPHIQMTKPDEDILNTAAFLETAATFRPHPHHPYEHLSEPPQTLREALRKRHLEREGL